MNDAVAHALARRRELDSGFSPVTLASTAVHGAFAAAFLFSFGSRPAPSVQVASISSVPFGEIMGIPYPSQGGASATLPEQVLKPVGATPTRRAASLPFSAPRPSEPPTVATGQGAGTNLPSSGGSPLTLGDPHGVSSPYGWYLAGVQAKVWAIWASQVHPDLVMRGGSIHHS